MFALELAFLSCVFVLPFLGMLYFAAKPRERGLNEYGLVFFLAINLLVSALALAILIANPEQNSVYQLAPLINASGRFNVAFAITSERIIWVLNLSLGLLALTTNFFSNGLFSKWSPSRFFLLMASLPVASFLFLSEQVYVAVFAAELLWILFVFFDQEESESASIAARKSMTHRNFFLVSVLAVSALLCVLGAPRELVVTGATILYGFSFLFYGLVLRDWSQAFSFFVKILVGLYFVAQFNISLVKDQQVAQVLSCLYLLPALFYAALIGMTKEFRNSVSHVILAGIGLVLSAFVLRVNGLGAPERLSLEIAALLVALALVLAMHWQFRPAPSSRGWVYAIIALFVAPLLPGVLLISLSGQEFNGDIAQQLQLGFYGFIFALYGFGIGRLLMAGKEIPASAAAAKRNDYWIDAFAFVVLVLIGVAVWYADTDKLVKLIAESSVTLRLAIFSIIYVGLVAAGYFMSRGKRWVLGSSRYEAWTGASSPRFYAYDLLRTTAVRMWEYRMALTNSLSARAGKSGRAVNDFDDRALGTTLWSEGRAFLFSGSSLLRYAHSGLIRSFWFWGLLIWIISGVLLGLR